jgi:hypothetical protein
MERRPLTLFLLSACLIFLSLGALYGGSRLLADVSGESFGMPASWLAGSIFPNYFIPGLFLFMVFGIGSLIVLYALWARPDIEWLSSITRPLHEHWAWLGTLLIGVALVVWIVIQYTTIQVFNPLQIVMGVLGVVIVVLDLLPGVRRYYRE